MLACADGINNKAVAARQRVTQQIVSKWRGRFVAHRLDGLLDAPRPGAPRSIDDAQVDAVVAKTLESVSAAATHWSTRSMARETGMTQTAVNRIWRAFGLQPHRQETFKLSTDPLFVEKVPTRWEQPIATQQLAQSIEVRRDAAIDRDSFGLARVAGVAGNNGQRTR